MKIIIPGVDYVFECGGEKCCSIVIENQRVFRDCLMDLANQTQGNEGISVLSEDNKVISIAKKAELLNQFVPFDVNQKGLLTKITARMQEVAMDGEHYLSSNQILADWERYLMGLAVELPGNFLYSKISIDSVIKAAGLKIDDDYDSLGEELLDYMELVQEYESNKLFIFVNLRSYMLDKEAEAFFQEISKRKIQTLFIEGSEHPLLNFEDRHIIDEDCCLIC